MAAGGSSTSSVSSSQHQPASSTGSANNTTSEFRPGQALEQRRRMGDSATGGQRRRSTHSHRTSQSHLCQEISRDRQIQTSSIITRTTITRQHILFYPRLIRQSQRNTETPSLP
ncbi:unnamed protein product [Jaminaea pallidilutea]